mmetsp:Transcript_33475/g.81065  ORF Transcript_33475/g.81065 Transcript_33475/m.81065 type:complete len:620 (+) Transcript_33475:208-2067(+)
MSAAQRNTEIWSTRLQRELLALTTDNASPEAQEEIMSVLPNFVSVKDHELSIEKGICIVSFYVRPKESMANPIIVSLDASLQRKDSGELDPLAVAYPFLKPWAILKSGSKCFPKGSTIREGDYVDIEMDWTPSLHLTDAILNIGLKIKESILQSEPFHPAIFEDPKTDPLGEMANTARRMAASAKSSLNKLTKTSDPPSPKKRNMRKKRGKRDQIRIGDEISMLDAPWVDCQGVYSCKAIRRPKFVEEAMAKAAKNKEAAEAAAKASSGTIAGTFRSIANSARGVLEESFLMVTEQHIIEMRSNKLNLSTGVIAFAIPIEMLAKLKFRRQESLSLFFKPQPDDPLIFMCPDSSDCVHQIQSVLKRHGVKGKHTNAATHRAINQALHLVQEIQTMELALKHDPSVERVNEIMDLYRQAAERFESAGDVRHEEVVTHMRKFLALPLTVGILDGSYKNTNQEEDLQKTGEDGEMEGVVLETKPSDDEEAEKKEPVPAPAPAPAAPEPTAAAEEKKPKEEKAPKEEEKVVPEGEPLDTEANVLHKLRMSAANGDDQAFHENMESILREAEADLANLKDMEGDDPELEIMMEETEDYDGGDDAIADFENMLKAADDELAALMNS